MLNASSNIYHKARYSGGDMDAVRLFICFGSCLLLGVRAPVTNFWTSSTSPGQEDYISSQTCLMSDKT